MVNDVAQEPIEGVSMTYTWDKANANAPGQLTTQYFEMFGSHGIPRRVDRLGSSRRCALGRLVEAAPTDIMNGFKWQLYNLTKDWT